MINLYKLKSIKHIITHENCPDGIASAIILKDVLPKAKISFYQPETLAHKNIPVEEDLLFCDISPPKDRYKEFIKAEAIVLDHHKTSKNIVLEFGELGVFADEKNDPGISGAVLAFKEVWQKLAKSCGKLSIKEELSTRPYIRYFAKLIGIRDTWQSKDLKFKNACEISEVLTFWPIEELLETEFNSDKWNYIISFGDILYKKHLISANNRINKGYRFTSKFGTRVIIFNERKYTSDVTGLLGNEVDLIIGFDYIFDDNEQKILVSTRSHTNFDCAKFCNSFGGGGHTKAAGCSFNLSKGDSQPYFFLKDKLELYELNNLEKLILL